MNQAEKLVLEFAGQKKTNAKDLLELAKKIQQMARIRPREEVHQRVVNPDSMLIRSHVLDLKHEFTSAEVAENLGLTTTLVNNNLYALERAKLIYNTGKKYRTGHKGHPSVVWKTGAKDD